MGKGGDPSEIISQSRTCFFFSIYSLPSSSKRCSTDSAVEQTPPWGRDYVPGHHKKPAKSQPGKQNAQCNHSANLWLRQRNKTSEIEKETQTYSFSGTACPRCAARQLCLPGYPTAFSRCFKFSNFRQPMQVGCL